MTTTIDPSTTTPEPAAPAALPAARGKQRKLKWPGFGLVFAVVFLGGLTLMAIFADYLSFIPYPDALIPGPDGRPGRYEWGPSWTAWFGTDGVSNDVFSKTIYGSRTSLQVGVFATVFGIVVGGVLGVIAGYFRGWVDDVIQYLYTVLNSIPGVLLIAAAVLMMQVVIDTHPQWFSTAAERADLRLLALCFILGITSWTGLCRLLRGETLKLRELEYIQAAQAFGVSNWRIIVRHILPNLMHIVIIALVMDFSGLVLAEAVLSYVGIGVDPSMTSFGTMINNARMELGREPVVWWSLAAAFAAMFILVLAANLFADAVRDAFDPRAA